MYTTPPVVCFFYDFIDNNFIDNDYHSFEFLIHSAKQI